MSAKGAGAKRSLRTISAHGKLEAIRRVHDGESKASVARDIGVPESTLRGWCKNESKISYLSRQSSPETDESLESKEKRVKLDEALQPFNLSLKSGGQPIYAPSSEALYTPMDYSKSEMECTPKTPQNLSLKNETPKSTASQDRNKVELARLSVELGLNRPEFNTGTSASNLAELAANFTLLNQWNILVQQQLQKATPPKQKLPKEQQSTEEYINGWLKKQQQDHRVTTNGIPANTPTTSNVQCSWFWNWYKQMNYQQQPATPVNNEKPILYQQLTKDTTLNEVEHPATVKVKTVLDNLLNNNNVVNEKKECLSYSEALEHGEKFLKWLESCSNPSITAMQIMQFKTLLGNVRNSDRKNGDLNGKTKVKRK